MTGDVRMPSPVFDFNNPLTIDSVAAYGVDSARGDRIAAAPG
jgi:hypothetical protein